MQHPRIPIFIAGVNTPLCRLAGELADGFHVHPYHTVKYLTEVVRHIKDDSGLPFIILVSNWSLMTEDRYQALREAGVDEFCVSLDFPDERHDEFRGHAGLYQYLDTIVPRLAALGHDDIVLNNCIHAENVGEINRIADKAKEWGVNVNFSAYSPRRTGCQDLFLNAPEQLETLGDIGQIVVGQVRLDVGVWLCLFFAEVFVGNGLIRIAGLSDLSSGKRQRRVDLILAFKIAFGFREEAQKLVVVEKALVPTLLQ